VRRARGYRLYDPSGARYLDLYQDDGGAILGHRSAGALRDMKDALSRGLTSRLPSVYQTRLTRAVGRLLPGCATVQAYHCLHAALRAASVFLGSTLSEADIHDPAFGPAAEGTPAAFWRPFLPPLEGPGPRVVFPVLPPGGTTGPVAVCFREPPPGLPADPVAPYLLAGMLRGAADLAVAVRDDAADRAVAAALTGSRSWRCRGPYVTAVFEPSLYPEVFRAFLEGGVLLRPTFPGPSILPGEATAGERQVLTRLFTRIPGG
jgi:hypothetical protein